MVFFIKRYENKGKALRIDIDIVESFHQCFARLHKLGQGNCQTFNGLFDRQRAGMDSIAGQFRYQLLTGLGHRNVACQAQKKLGTNFKGRNPEPKGDIVPTALHCFGKVGNPNQIGIGFKVDT